MKEIFTKKIEANIPFVEFVEAAFNRGGVMVDVGCGDKKADPSFIGIDPYYENDGIDYKAYMWEMPLEDNSVDFLVCFSALEHISKFLVVPTLVEFARVLKPGAQFAIVVPNLFYAFNEFVKNPNTGWEMDLIFGHQRAEGEFHQTGFTPEIIKGYFNNIPVLKLINIYDINAYTQWNYGIIGEKIST